MTSATARTVTNVVLVSAGVAAAFVILTNPPLRRLAMRATKLWLGVSVPAYLLDETRRAWVESGQAA
ncbi:MAG TPA: hypothetical protein VGQ16_14775 [Vicinamibacterales bacterium]|nr:hypothetical protein [Vicinamibacterales bacterium]